MDNKQLCSNCQTGKDAYELDKREPMCPYLGFHNGDTCTMFKPIKEDEK